MLNIKWELNGEHINEGNIVDFLKIGQHYLSGKVFDTSQLDAASVKNDIIYYAISRVNRLFNPTGNDSDMCLRSYYRTCLYWCHKTLIRENLRYQSDYISDTDAVDKVIDTISPVESSLVEDGILAYLGTFLSERDVSMMQMSGDFSNIEIGKALGIEPCTVSRRIKKVQEIIKKENTRSQFFMPYNIGG